MTDIIDQDTMYFDGQPPEWTFEKLETLRENGELEGNIDVASDGTVLDKVEYFENSFKHYCFSRQIEIFPNIFYEIEKVYGKRNTCFELRRVCSFHNDDLYINFSTTKSKEEVAEMIEKMFESGIIKRKSKLGECNA